VLSAHPPPGRRAVKACCAGAATQIEHVIRNQAKKGGTVSHQGHAIGYYLGKPIFESIEVQDEAYVFDRIAEYEDDEFPLDRLSANELLVQPGLIYRHKD
jgi:hypothetical protein